MRIVKETIYEAFDLFEYKIDEEQRQHGIRVSLYKDNPEYETCFEWLYITSLSNSFDTTNVLESLANYFGIVRIGETVINTYRPLSLIFDETYPTNHKGNPPFIVRIGTPNVGTTYRTFSGATSNSTICHLISTMRARQKVNYNTEIVVVEEDSTDQKDLKIVTLKYNNLEKNND